MPLTPRGLRETMVTSVVDRAPQQCLRVAGAVVRPAARGPLHGQGLHLRHLPLVAPRRTRAPSSRSAASSTGSGRGPPASPKPTGRRVGRHAPLYVSARRRWVVGDVHHDARRRDGLPCASSSATSSHWTLHTTSPGRTPQTRRRVDARRRRARPSARGRSPSPHASSTASTAAGSSIASLAAVALAVGSCVALAKGARSTRRATPTPSCGSWSCGRSSTSASASSCSSTAPRAHRRRMTARHDIDIANVALYWHFAALTAAVTRRRARRLPGRVTPSSPRSAGGGSASRALVAGLAWARPLRRHLRHRRRVVRQGRRPRRASAPRTAAAYTAVALVVIAAVARDAWAHLPPRRRPHAARRRHRRGFSHRLGLATFLLAGLSAVATLYAAPRRGAHRELPVSPRALVVAASLALAWAALARRGALVRRPHGRPHVCRRRRAAPRARGSRVVDSTSRAARRRFGPVAARRSWSSPRCGRMRPALHRAARHTAGGRRGPDRRASSRRGSSWALGPRARAPAPRSSRCSSPRCT